VSFIATASFRCDGCRIESQPIELCADILQAVLPVKWLRVETGEVQREIDVRSIKHFCPICAPLVAAFLNTRRQAQA